MMIPEGGYYGKNNERQTICIRRGALKRRKKQARQEAKLMLEIGAANKDLKKAQKRQSKAQARLEARSTSLQTLEAKLAELRAQSLEPEIAAPPQSAELEHQQEPSELESSIGSSDGKQPASPETGDSTSTDEEQHAPVVEETAPSEVIVATKDMIERQAVQNQETATESDTSPYTTDAREGTCTSDGGANIDCHETTSQS